MVLYFPSSLSMALVVTDASIKNNIAIFISHVHSGYRPLIKTVYHTAFITSIEAEFIKIVDSGLCFYFLFSLYFIFHFIFLFFFYFQNNSGQSLSVMLSHQSQIDGIVTRLIMGLGRMKQKILEQSDVIQHGQHMLASCYTHGYLGQGVQQLAQTMGNSI